MTGDTGVPVPQLLSEITLREVTASEPLHVKISRQIRRCVGVYEVVGGKAGFGKRKKSVLLQKICVEAKESLTKFFC